MENKTDQVNKSIVEIQNLPTQTVALNLNISGMTCANCALKIDTKLKKLPGISQSNVILPTESAKVVFNIKTTNIDEILKSIKDLGYKASLSKVEILVEDSLSQG
jgi:P-type Cu+ transporter